MFLLIEKGPHTLLSLFVILNTFSPTAPPSARHATPQLETSPRVRYIRTRLERRRKPASGVPKCLFLSTSRSSWCTTTLRRVQRGMPAAPPHVLEGVGAASM